MTPTTPPNNVSFEAVVLHRCAEGVLGRSQVWHGGTVMFGENPLGWHCSWLYAHLGPVVSPCSKAAPGPRPTIITPHGGPHSVYTAQYFMPFAYLVSLGVRYWAAAGFWIVLRCCWQAAPAVLHAFRIPGVPRGAVLDCC